MIFNKANGKWEKWAFERNYTNHTITFTISLEPCEMKLIRLNTDIAPAINLLMGD